MFNSVRPAARGLRPAAMYEPALTLYTPSIRLLIRLLDSHAYFLTASRHMKRHTINSHSLSQYSIA